MKWFYIRWGGILLAGLLVGFLGLQRYDQEVTTTSPEQLLSNQPGGTVRVLGTVRAGSLDVTGTGMDRPYEASFYLTGDEGGIPVHYSGERPENLRELKRLVVVGTWDASELEFRAHDIMILPNYGYVAAAYLIGMVPIGLFLFRMERRVELLYTEIKVAKAYEPEEVGFEER